MEEVLTKLKETAFMDKAYQKKVLILALYAGELMMKNGAEIYRVEDTIVRICKACRIPYVECFATGTGIFLSLDKGGADDDVYTFIKRIHSTSTDLMKISQINDFSRRFSSTDLSVEEGMDILRDIDQQKPYPKAIRFLGAGLVGLAFCFMFGGGWKECLLSLFVVLGTHFISGVIGRLQFNQFIRIFLSCSFATVASILLSYAIPGILISPMIIASVTIFLPGVSITNSARDLLSGQTLAGMAKATEAMIIAVAIAVGVGFVLQIWQISGGVL